MNRFAGRDETTVVVRLTKSLDVGKVCLNVIQAVVPAVSADPVEILRVMEPGGTTSFEAARFRTEDTRKLFGLDKNAIISPRILNTCWNSEGTEIAVSVTVDPNNTSLSRTFRVSSNSNPQTIERATAPDRLLRIEDQVNWSLRVNKGKISAYISPTKKRGTLFGIANMPSGDFDLSLGNSTYICANPGRRGTNGKILLSSISIDEFRK